MKRTRHAAATGGNKARNQSGGVIYRGGVTRGQVNNLYTVTPPNSPGTSTCPTCHHDVPVRADLSLVAHRIGPTKAVAWLCPGDPRQP